MLFTETELKGAFIIDIELHEDERGFFARTWCEDEFKQLGLNPKLVQCNISFNKKRGTLRGLHYQRPFPEAKLVRCTQGAIFDVIIDLRIGSPTFQQWLAVELSAQNRRALYIPENFAHGFQTLLKNTEVFYQMSEFYHAECACGVRWDDPMFGVIWPIQSPIISEKDRSYLSWRAGVRVLVTGASGFIGSHVTRELVNAGHKVLALVLPNDKLVRLQDSLSTFDILRGTLQDVTQFQEQLSRWQPEACIHLAWYAEPGKYLSAMENIISLHDSVKLLHCLSACGCAYFIGAGTCAEYEMKSEMLAETDKTKPETLYAASKLSFQMIGEQISRQFGMQFAWGRIFYLYGKQEDPRRLIPAAILKLQNNEIFAASRGEQIRDYLHVKDVAIALSTLAEKRAEGIFNISSAEPVTIRSILEKIGDLTGKSELLKFGLLPYRDWEPMHICGNNDRLKSTGWSPGISLEAGLQESINWFNAQKDQ